MTFSNEWEEQYQANSHNSIWPWSDLVSFVMRYTPPDKARLRVLELGCGAGANIPFFLSLGVQYLAIEGSQTAVKRLWKRFPGLQDNIMIGDFTEAIDVAGQVDLVIDRASLTHNNTEAIKRGVSLIYEKLRPGGQFIGIDWFSTKHEDYRRGLPAEDLFTRCGYQKGQFVNVGRVHFSDRGHLEELLTPLVIQVLEHNLITREIPEKYVMGRWNLVAMKV